MKTNRIISLLSYLSDGEKMPSITRLGNQFEFTMHKGLEKSNTFLSSFDTFLREPITKLAFPPGTLLAGLTQ